MSPERGTGRGRRGAGGRGPSLLESGALGPARADSPACLQFSLFPGDSHFIFGKAACSVTNLFLNKPNPGGGEVGRGLSHSPLKGTTPQLWAWLYPRDPISWGPLSPGLKATPMLSNGDTLGSQGSQAAE